MRRVSALLVGACILTMFGCRDAQPRDERVDLGQNVTVKQKARDKEFVEFEKNWRKFVTTSAEMALPVIVPERPAQPEPWEPLVVTECVYSADADGLVAQATLTWNEPVRGDTPARASQQQPARSRDAERWRFDLGVHHNALGRNYYSSVLAGQPLQRFQLPANSALVKDEQALLLTGPSLFPKLMSFRSAAIQDRDTQAMLEQHTLVLRDLSEGLSYTIRLDRPADNRWTEEKRFTFLTPVCPAGT